MTSSQLRQGCVRTYCWRDKSSDILVRDVLTCQSPFFYLCSVDHRYLCYLRQLPQHLQHMSRLNAHTD